MSGIKAFKDFVGFGSIWGWVKGGSEIWVRLGTDGKIWVWVDIGADGSKIWVSLGSGEIGSKFWANQGSELSVANRTDARISTDLGLWKLMG